MKHRGRSSSTSALIGCGLVLGALLGACGRHATPPPSTGVSVPPLRGTAGTTEVSSQGFFDAKHNPGAATGVPVDPRNLTPTQLQYGIAPRRDPRVTYAPDVILMEEGDKAIRLTASDGMTWVFDASAPHVNEFQEGKVVFATGRAVGRIGQLTRSGDTVTV